jgi:hypothetical protein
MPVFALGDMTQRASLLVTALLVFGVEACGGDTDGALFGTSGNGARRGTGGSASASGGNADTSGGSGNGGSGSVSGSASAGGTMSGSGGITPGTGGGTPSSGGSVSGGAAGSSGGTTATGGTVSTGGKAPPGSGGGDSDAGSGGTEIDSGLGTGGAPPDSGDGGGPTGDGKVRCGDTTCDKSAGQLCCIKENMGRATATCTTSAMGCVHAFRCDSDRDCSRGEHCCMDFPNAGNTPNTSCAKECPSPISCSVPDDCGDGESCCGVVIQGPAAGVRYESVACQQKCGEDTPFCTGNSQCSGNTSCQQSQTLPPGYLVCR